MTRAADPDVQAIIDYDDDKPIPSMEPFIRAASRLVDKVDSNDTSNTLSNGELKEIEIWLAAHFYAHKDLQFTRHRSGRSEGYFQVGMVEAGPLNVTIWGKQAMLLDTTGYLADLNKNVVSGGNEITLSWLGKAPSTQTDYIDRD